jgi:hypothetical protein
MDHDQLFKDLLTTFFAEFLELFFPKMAAELDRSSIEFLDKELSTDIAAGERHEVDLVAKVRLNGQEAFILVHVENQASYQTEFPKRMFNYFALLHKKFDLPVFPIAIFSYDRPLTPAVDTYSLELFEVTILRFHFQTIQLNRLSWREFLARPNPVASALMSKMSIAPSDRPRVKLECLRMMLTLKYDPARTELIARFMNSYLMLTEAEEVVYTKEAQVLSPEEKELDMLYTNEWERRGCIKERLKLISHFFKRRFGELPHEVTDRISHLSDEQSTALVDIMFDFASLSDATTWLSQAEPVQAGT